MSKYRVVKRELDGLTRYTVEKNIIPPGGNDTVWMSIGTSYDETFWPYIISEDKISDVPGEIIHEE